MHRRSVLTVIIAVTVAVTTGYSLGHRDRAHPADAAQPTATWNSAMLWNPTLVETGDALAALVNQIDASCTVDVDPTVPTNGVTPDGTVYAVAVTWACPASGMESSGATRNSATLWYPPTLAETGDALADLTNQIDASCALDVDRLVAANGSGPEGPVYAFAVTWACPGAPQAVAAVPSGSAATVTLETGNFAFSPTQLTIPANTAIPIAVTNVSDLPHTFTIETLGVTVEIPPGETRTVTVTAAPGTYTYVCTYHADRMIGSLIAEG